MLLIPGLHFEPLTQGNTNNGKMVRFDTCFHTDIVPGKNAEACAEKADWNQMGQACVPSASFPERYTQVRNGLWFLSQQCSQNEALINSPSHLKEAASIYYLLTS